MHDSHLEKDPMGGPDKPCPNAGKKIKALQIDVEEVTAIGTGKG